MELKSYQGGKRNTKMPPTQPLMELRSLQIIILVFSLSPEVSASTLSLNFVDSYMTMYDLKFPLFVLHPLDLDTFYEEIADLTFQTFSCYCYEEGKVIYNIETKKSCYAQIF